MPRSPTPVIDRLMNRVEMIPFSGCWIYMGALNQAGYGWIGAGSREVGVDRAHRVTYKHFKGKIPEGKEIDHLCRVRSCCNPEHLEAVTRQVNANRGECGKKTGEKNTAKTHCKHGHEFTTSNTYTYKSKKGSIHRHCITCMNDRRKA